ncbi:MAG TPA: chitobiase/beta-hexosaminidase C-terminal domain-containing protein [Terracidiphilus sp.]|nr:chitobiase/beta-hexosaminidase C-terminal domain-containing protein [Terracidiphilus sp.]
MIKVVALSLPRRDSRFIGILHFALLNLALALLFLAQRAVSQYSTVEVNTMAAFPKPAQAGFGFGAAFSTDGTWLAYSTGNAVWSQSIKGGKLHRLFTTGTVLPGSDIKAKLIYPQTEVSDGIIVFLATDEGGESGLYGLYAIKADGSGPARRVADSTQATEAINWSNFMNPEGVYGFYQVAKGVVVFGLQGGTLYAVNIDGSHLRPIWQVESGGFAGCSSGGEYHSIFLVNQAFQPATDGTNYAFGAGNYLDFAGVYHGPLKTANACGDLIDSGDSIDDPSLKILPGQPQAGAAFAFPQGQNFQIDDGFVYFGAYSSHGVSSTEDYYGYFKVPLKGGKASVLVSNISHVPGLLGPHGQATQLKLLGFAVRDGRFIFAAQDEAQKHPESFYMVDGDSYVKIFQSGTSVSNHCVGSLDSGFADEATINQNTLTADGKLVFYAFDAPPTYPDAHGPCSYPQFDYIHLPFGFFVVDTTHPMIPTETEISLSVSQPIVYGEKPSLRIKVMPAEGARNPKDLVPTGVVSVYYTNPQYFGNQHPTPNMATLDSDGKATIALGAQQNGTYSYVVAYGGDANFSSSASRTLQFLLHVTAPVFSVKGGTYSSAQSITLTDSTPGSTIYYTTDGKAPTKKSKQFLNAITVSSGKETIKAMAVATGDAQSAVVTQSYTIK